LDSGDRAQLPEGRCNESRNVLKEGRSTIRGPRTGSELVCVGNPAPSPCPHSRRIAAGKRAGKGSVGRERNGAPQPGRCFLVGTKKEMVNSTGNSGTKSVHKRPQTIPKFREKSHQRCKSDGVKCTKGGTKRKKRAPILNGERLSREREEKGLTGGKKAKGSGRNSRSDDDRGWIPARKKGKER